VSLDVKIRDNEILCQEERTAYSAPYRSRFCNKRAGEVVEASGSILFRNVKIEPADKGRSLNSRPTWP